MATHSSVRAWRIPGTGAWWAAICGVAQSRTRLKRLSSSIHVSSLLFFKIWKLYLLLLTLSNYLNKKKKQFSNTD